MLARLQLWLHALDADPLRGALSTAGFDPAGLTVQRDLDAAARDVDRARLHGLRPILDWLIAHRPPEPAAQVMCHGDFHPFNVLVETGQPSGVIDWVNLRFADPAYDVGATTALLTHGPLDLPAGVRAAAAVGRRVLVAAYRRTYLRERPLERDRLGYYEALRTFGFLLEAGMVRQSAAGIIDPCSKPTAFASPHVQRGAARRLRALTGVTPGAG
jgi:aminoglycoside phosphotransferase (APT) family kinase protein